MNALMFYNWCEIKEYYLADNPSSSLPAKWLPLLIIVKQGFISSRWSSWSPEVNKKTK